MRVPVGMSFIAIVICSIPIALGFVLPLSVLIKDATGYFSGAIDILFLNSISNSLLLSGLASMLTVFVGVLMAYGMRLNKGVFYSVITRFASLGYAIPGAVLAIGIFLPMGLLDN